MEKRGVLVIGDAMLDQRIEGQLSRISPEAPAPVLLAEQFSDALGGAANVAANLRKMVPAVTFVSTVGDDAGGQRIQALLTSNDPVSWQPLVTRVPYGTSTTRLRMIAQGQQVLRVDTESVGVDNLAMVQTVTQLLTPPCEWSAVVVSDYAKGTVSPEVVRAIMQGAATLSVPLFVNTKPAKMELYFRASVLVVNEAEAVSYATEYNTAGGVAMSLAQDDGSLVFAARQICRTLEPAVLVVTLGERGAFVMERTAATGKYTEVHYAATAAYVCERAGAGDSFLAALVAEASMPLPYAVRSANLAGSLAVSRPGIAVISADDIDELRFRQLPREQRLLSQPALDKWVRHQRGRLRQIVFANGCFDGLHAGHIYLLEQARQQGDVLVVACNSDASLCRIKGLEQPLVPQAQRAAQLTHFADAVVLFDEDTPLELIKSVRPAVLVKGADYANRPIVGDDFVVSHGGVIFLAETLPGFSSSLLRQGAADARAGDIHDHS